jgi:hypothetical protein
MRIETSQPALLSLAFSCLLFPAAGVDVRLVDSHTGGAIANTDVQVLSDNGIRCIRAPCPTNYREWNGRSDAAGHVSVPPETFSADTRFYVRPYEPTAALPQDAAKAAAWQVELDPPGSDTEGGMRVERVKLLDKVTGQPLANANFWVATGRTCRSRTCPEAVLSGVTNTLGNAFVPLARIPDLDRKLWIGADGHQSLEYSPPEPAIALPRR